jgi:hypothetical protein
MINDRSPSLGTRSSFQPSVPKDGRLEGWIGGKLEQRSMERGATICMLAGSFYCSRTEVESSAIEALYFIYFIIKEVRI